MQYEDHPRTTSHGTYITLSGSESEVARAQSRALNEVESRDGNSSRTVFSHCTHDKNFLHGGSMT